MSDQCEGCLNYEDILSLVCDSCLEKALVFDHHINIKRSLYRTVIFALDDLEHAIQSGISDDIAVLLISSAIGRLKAAKQLNRQFIKDPDGEYFQVKQ